MGVHSHGAVECHTLAESPLWILVFVVRSVLLSSGVGWALWLQGMGWRTANALKCITWLWRAAQETVSVGDFQVIIIQLWECQGLYVVTYSKHVNTQHSDCGNRRRASGYWKRFIMLTWHLGQLCSHWQTNDKAARLRSVCFPCAC